MSTFKKRLAETRNMRKIAEGDIANDKQAFLQALTNAGVNFPGGNEKVLDDHQWQKIGVLDIIAGPLANDFIAAGAGQGQVDFLNQKVQEFDGALGQWSNTFYNKLGEDTIKKLTNALIRNKDASKGLFTVVNFSQAGSGNKKISAVEGEEDNDDDLEEVTKELVAEFEARVRSLLSALKQ